MTEFFVRYWKGLACGFAFGSVGLWLLAALSLVSAAFETVSAVLFAPGQLLASLLAPSGSAGTGVVVVLFLANAILYACIGLLIEIGVLRLRRKDTGATRI